MLNYSGLPAVTLFTKRHRIQNGVYTKIFFTIIVTFTSNNFTKVIQFAFKNTFYERHLCELVFQISKNGAKKIIIGTF